MKNNKFKPALMRQTKNEQFYEQMQKAQNLQHYEFFPRGMDLAAYGRELAVRNGVIPPSRLITDAFDGAAYAEANMGQYGLSTTDHGYVAWNGGERRYEYSQPEHHSPALSI